MPEQLDADKRYARLTGSEEPGTPGGGIPLPGAFHSVLYYLLNNGGAASAEALTKVIRENVGEDLSGNRVRYVWGSWENLAADIFAQLQERELISPTGFGWWVLCNDFPSGKRIYILYYPDGRDIRVIVRSRSEHEAREKLARARSRILEYRAQLEVSGLYHGKIKSTLDKHLESLRWDDGEKPEPASTEVIIPEGFTWIPDRTHGAVSRFAGRYVKARYPDWVTGSEVARAFNALNPGVKPITLTQPFERMMTLVRKGTLEREDDDEHRYQGRPKAMFRWVPPK